jgi:hypothetical protein
MKRDKQSDKQPVMQNAVEDNKQDDKQPVIQHAVQDDKQDNQEETPTILHRVKGWWSSYQFAIGFLAGSATILVGSFLRSKRI